MSGGNPNGDKSQQTAVPSGRSRCGCRRRLYLTHRMRPYQNTTHMSIQMPVDVFGTNGVLTYFLVPNFPHINSIDVYPGPNRLTPPRSHWLAVAPPNRSPAAGMDEVTRLMGIVQLSPSSNISTHRNVNTPLPRDESSQNHSETSSSSNFEETSQDERKPDSAISTQ